VATLQSITWVKFERHKHLENIVDPLCQLLYKAVITKDGYYKAFFSLAEENKGLLNTIKQKSDEYDLIYRIKKLPSHDSNTSYQMIMQFLDGVECINLKRREHLRGQFWDTMQICNPEC